MCLTLYKYVHLFLKPFYPNCEALCKSGTRVLTEMWVLFYNTLIPVLSLLVYVSSMEGGELFSRIQARGDQAFTEKGED